MIRSTWEGDLWKVDRWEGEAPAEPFCVRGSFNHPATPSARTARGRLALPASAGILRIMNATRAAFAAISIALATIAHVTEDRQRATAQPATAQGNWIQLFNGRDLDGWTPKITKHDLGENFADTFRVEQGVLKVSYDGYETFDGQFGHLFYKQPYSHYRLRIEYRFTGEQCPGGPEWARRNSGVMIHGQDPATMSRDQEFPVSLEVQFLGGLGEGPRTTANLCTPGTNVVMAGELVTRHCTDSTSETYDGDQWVAVEIEVRGGEVIRHLIDGKVVLEYSEPQLDPKDPRAEALIAARKAEDSLMLTGGTISLQAESHPVEFRKVELLPLEAGRRAE